MQKQVAQQLRVNPESLKNWERGASDPSASQIPRIIEFLGYNPEPKPEGLAARITHARRQLALTQEALAQVLRVDPVTLYHWEKGHSEPDQARQRQLEALAPAKK